MLRALLVRVSNLIGANGGTPRMTRAGYALTFVLLASATAHAQSYEAIHLEYRVPSNADCPSQDAFRAAIVERAAVQFVEAAAASRVYKVEILKISDGTFDGYLIVEAAGGATRRAVRGKSCAEVASALGFVAALAIDSTRSVASPAVIEETPSTTRPAAPPVRRPWLDAGLSLGGAYGAMPSLAPTASVFGDIRIDRFRVGAALVFGQSNTSAEASKATLRWSVGRLDGCAVAYMGIIVLDGCVRAEAGLLSGKGSEITAAKRANRPWLDLGAGQRGS